MSVTRIIGGDLLTGRVRASNIPCKPASMTKDLGIGRVDATVRLPMRDPTTGVILDLPTVLVPGRSYLGYVQGSKIVEAGPIWVDDFDTDSSKHTMNALGLRSIANFRYVLDLLATGELPKDKVAYFNNISLRTQVKRLWELAQKWNPTLPIVFEADVVGTSERTYPGIDLMRMSDALTNLENVLLGPEQSLRPQFVPGTNEQYVQWVLKTGNPLLSQYPAPVHVWDTSVVGSTVKGTRIRRDAQFLVTDSYQRGDDVPVLDATGQPLGEPVALQAKAHSDALLYSDTLHNRFTNPRLANPVAGIAAGGTAFTAGTLAGGLATCSLGIQTFAVTSMNTAAEFGAYFDVVVPTGTTQRTVAVDFTKAGSGSLRAALTVQPYLDAATVGAPVTVNSTAAGGILSATVTPASPVNKLRVTMTILNTSGGTIAVASSVAFASPRVTSGLTAPSFNGSTARDDLYDYFWEGVVDASVSLRRLRVGYMTMQSATTRYSVTELPTLQAYADDAVVAGQFPLEVWEFKARKNSTPKLEDYNEGDDAIIVIGENNPRKAKGRYPVRIMTITADLTQWVTIKCAPARVPA